MSSQILRQEVISNQLHRGIMEIMEVLRGRNDLCCEVCCMPKLVVLEMHFGNILLWICKECIEEAHEKIKET